MISFKEFVRLKIEETYTDSMAALHYTNTDELVKKFVQLVGPSDPNSEKVLAAWKRFQQTGQGDENKLRSVIIRGILDRQELGVQPEQKPAASQVGPWQRDDQSGVRAAQAPLVAQGDYERPTKVQLKEPDPHARDWDYIRGGPKRADYLN